MLMFLKQFQKHLLHIQFLKIR